MTDQKITWDLSELFDNINDPKIDQTIAEATTFANTFEKTYRGKILNLKTDALLQSLKSIEAFKAKFRKITLFANLNFSANMTLPQTQFLHDKVKKIKAAIEKQLVFYQIELGNLLKHNPKIIREPVLINYRHMLERVYRRVKYQLSEVEEQLIIEKDQFGVNAWQELQSKWLNTRKFDVIVLGEKKTLSYGEANGLLSHIDRATRESANKSIYGLLRKDGEIFASALRNICNDWVNISKRRNYVSPMESSLISNDTKKEIIDSLLVTIEENAGIYRRYLKLKAKLMELTILGNHDIIAPIPGLRKLKFTFRQAQDLIIQANSRFDAQYTLAAKEMFSKRHIDAAPRFGKRNGAFCASYYTGKSAYILTSFSGTLSDVFTLAHEIGHATHDWYASRNQTLLNTDIPATVAEVASIFGELLLTDLLLEKAKTDAERQAVLCLVLDEAGMIAFQVTARVWFEQTLYNSIQKGKFLDYTTICGQWTTARDRIYGEAVTWFPEMEAEWSMKPHYFMANYRFYNYPYVYAQIFAYSLYEQYMKEGKEFVPRLKMALSAGSSLSPFEIGKIFNLNVSTPEFWKGGMKVFERLATRLQKMI